MNITTIGIREGFFGDSLTIRRNILQEKWPVKIFLLQPYLLYSMEKTMLCGV
jgi:hypothetical protein